MNDSIFEYSIPFDLSSYNYDSAIDVEFELKQNGYSWDGKKFLYNPYSILSYFDFGDFKNFWFETGTPTFLLKLMENQRMVKLEDLEVKKKEKISDSKYVIQSYTPTWRKL